MISYLFLVLVVVIIVLFCLGCGCHVPLGKCVRLLHEHHMGCNRCCKRKRNRRPLQIMDDVNEENAARTRRRAPKRVEGDTASRGAARGCPGS